MRAHFNVEPVHHVVVDPAIAHHLAGHDIYSDARYTDDPEYRDDLAENWSWVIDDGLADDDRFAIRWISPEKGYGLFAEVDIPAWSPIGPYTGALTNASRTDYGWSYPSKFVDEHGKNMTLTIDGQYRGNWLRFINHADEDYNSISVFVPHNGVWNMVYIARRDIPAGGEVTVTYGSGYWKSRPWKID
ncbi:hypothetical protein DFJ73DRAFT_850057 [Zopfochytrium polystomum]|nr:hypothetical protein DFJ73DRAFT_850057 [Zopfochytrium polystomum]